MFCLGQERIFFDSVAFTGPAVADVVGFYSSGDGWPSTFTITSTSAVDCVATAVMGTGFTLLSLLMTHDVSLLSG